MKNILLTIAFLLTTQFVKADPPVITLEYKYTVAKDTTHFQSMKSDNEFCCNFVVVSTPADSAESNITLIKHTETGVVLGKIYGKPTKDFIVKVCQTNGFLDKQKVDKLASDMLKLKF